MTLLSLANRIDSDSFFTLPYARWCIHFHPPWHRSHVLLTLTQASTPARGSSIHRIRRIFASILCPLLAQFGRMWNQRSMCHSLSPYQPIPIEHTKWRNYMRNRPRMRKQWKQMEQSVREVFSSHPLTVAVMLNFTLDSLRPIYINYVMHSYVILLSLPFTYRIPHSILMLSRHSYEFFPNIRHLLQLICPIMNWVYTPIQRSWELFSKHLQVKPRCHIWWKWNSPISEQ